jgi:uncharacterized protein DUF3558
MRPRLLVAPVAICLLAGGCASETPGVAKPDPDGAAPGPVHSSVSAEPGAAPPINSPELDLAAYQGRECELLTTAQLASFAIQENGVVRESPAGTACTWDAPDTTEGAHVDVVILGEAEGGWDGVYERRDRFPFFEDAGEVNGYPAVHRDTADYSARGTCYTTVGVRRDLVFETSVDMNVRNSPEWLNACEQSDAVASLVIDTLKSGR